MGISRSIFLSIVLLASGSSVAWPATLSNPNGQAAVVWVFNGSEPELADAPARLAGIATGMPGKPGFSIPADHVFFPPPPVLTENLGRLPALRNEIDSAMKAIKDQPHPELFVFTFSHGQDGMLCGGHCQVEHRALLNAVLDEVAAADRAHGTETQVNFFCSACYSGSLISEAKLKMREDAHTPKKVMVFASSQNDEKSFGNYFPEAIEVTNSFVAKARSLGLIKQCPECSSTDAFFKFFGPLNRHGKMRLVNWVEHSQHFQGWSSYANDANSKWTTPEFVALFSYAPDEELREYAFQILLNEHVSLEEEALSLHPEVREAVEMIRALSHPNESAHMETLLRALGNRHSHSELIRKVISERARPMARSVFDSTLDRKILTGGAIALSKLATDEEIAPENLASLVKRAPEIFLEHNDDEATQDLLGIFARQNEKSVSLLKAWLMSGKIEISRLLAHLGAKAPRGADGRRVLSEDDPNLKNFAIALKEIFHDSTVSPTTLTRLIREMKATAGMIGDRPSAVLDNLTHGVCFISNLEDRLNSP